VPADGTAAIARRRSPDFLTALADGPYITMALGIGAFAESWVVGPPRGAALFHIVSRLTFSSAG